MSDQLRIVIKQFSARKYNRGGRELFQRGERLLVLQREGACVIFVRESDRARTNPCMALSGSFDTNATLSNGTFRNSAPPQCGQDNGPL